MALALKSRLPSSEIIAADISSDALEVVKKNALKLELDIHYFQMDVLNSVQDFPFPLVDVIVSNPPYIPQSEKSTMEPHVLNFEPHLALFSPDEDPLLFYRFIGYFAKKYLKKGGSLYLELHAPLAEKNIELMQEMGFGKIELKKDMQGLDRMMKLVSLI